MLVHGRVGWWAGVGFAALFAAGCRSGAARDAPPAGEAVALAPAAMPRVGTVDERFQSYNVEMLEVTGGKFWKPYESDGTSPAHPRRPAPTTAAAGNTPAGMDPNAYAYRPPIDLTNARRRRLAAALGPAYVRVSGTWANTTYLPHAADTAAQPPPGFSGVLSRQQWKGVVDFAHAAN